MRTAQGKSLFHYTGELAQDNKTEEKEKKRKNGKKGREEVKGGRQDYLYRQHSLHRRKFDIKVDVILSPFACLQFFHFCLIF